MKKWLVRLGLVLAGFVAGMAACIHLYEIVERETHEEEYEDDEFECDDLDGDD